MAKPKNTEERNRIEKMAFQVLMNKGFQDTSFADIAMKSSVTRSLVQYYFPKKDIFIEEFIDQCLSEIASIVESSEYVDETNPIERLYAVGYMQFVFFLYNHQMENLKRDILRSRDNTTLIVKDVTNWAMNYLKDQPPEFKEKVAEAIRYSMGGAFEDIYYCLEAGKEVDGKQVSDQVIRIMNATLDLPDRTISITQQFPEDWLREQVNVLNKKLFG